MEEEAAQKERLTTSWELIAVLDFLSIFQPYLKLDHLSFSAEELESALVLNNGTSGLLPELHIVCSPVALFLVAGRLHLRGLHPELFYYVSNCGQVS